MTVRSSDAFVHKPLPWLAKRGAVTLAKYVYKRCERDLHVSRGRRILDGLGQFTPWRDASLGSRVAA